jgi:hypothetical protein
VPLPDRCIAGSADGVQGNTGPGLAPAAFHLKPAVTPIGFIEWRYGDPSLKDVLGWVGTLVSTFVGAAMAFTFNAIRVRRDREEKECVAGNLALITLVELMDRLLQYEHSYVKPVARKLDAWFSMRPGVLINVELKTDKTSLAFLLTKHTTTWRAIVLEETRFNVLKEAVDRRNKIVNESVWPKMEAKGFGHGSSVETAEIETVLGPATTQDLKSVTAFIMEICDIQSISACIADLRLALLTIYPHREFVIQPERINRQ